MCIIFGAQVGSGKVEPEKILKTIQDFSKENNLDLQLFDARYIYGKEHVITAVEHAKRAFSQARSRSGTLSMEILLFASGEYQIKNAITKLGVKDDTPALAFVILGELPDPEVQITELITTLNKTGVSLERNDETLIGDKGTLEQFGITAQELAAVPEEQWFELVLERVAMVDIKK